MTLYDGNKNAIKLHHKTRIQRDTDNSVQVKPINSLMQERDRDRKSQRQTERERGKEREREGRETDRQTETERQRHRQRERDRQTDRGRQRQTPDFFFFFLISSPHSKCNPYLYVCIVNSWRLGCWKRRSPGSTGKSRSCDWASCKAPCLSCARW